MSVKVTGVEKRSCSHKAGIKAGDILISLNGHEITDVLDYMFYSAEEKIEIRYIHGKKEHKARVKKSEYDDLGMQFDSFLMDKKQSCCNKCIFCFIDQMPPNMRETLYFKDDDARLSFLQGNYVTLTNLNDNDIKRIIDMRLNINVSVHTTNPELRCKMMNNRFAGEKLRYLKMMADSGLMLNCQIVCCPNINDGDELKRTLNDLYELMPQIQSTAVVPVGVTKYRDGLYPMEIFNEQTAGAVIDLIDEFQQKSLEKYGTRMAFAADEFYITAKRPLPEADYYEDYPQYENGVGLCRSLIDEVKQALMTAEYNGKSRKITIACGVIAAPVQEEIASLIKNKLPKIEIQVIPIINHFFGETITVSGLITAGDLTEQLKNRELGEELLITSSMLKADEPIFLDDISLDEVEQTLNIKITPTANDGFKYLDAVLGNDNL
ncbi:MAG: DUF512 domain-containing protein [Ruminococcus sp.]|nr:DUF512 domain-containing protein [Ruminococcus sp.]